MTPQPEESPDEILARRIELMQFRKECLEKELCHLQGGTEDFLIVQGDIDRAKKDLAMLEAHRAQRKLIMDYMPCTCAINFGVRSGTCPKCITVRQSDDAIRGMRG